MLGDCFILYLYEGITLNSNSNYRNVTELHFCYATHGNQTDPGP